MSNWFQPEVVYLIKDRKGNLAPRTKVYPSKSGAKNGLNNFIETIIDDKCQVASSSGIMWDIYYQYKYLGKKVDKLTPLNFNANSQLNQHGVITQEDIDKFYDMLRAAYDEWQIEEIVQNYG